MNTNGSHDMNRDAPVKPVLGADVELGNAWVGDEWHSNLEAARRLLREVFGSRRLRGVGPNDGRGSAAAEWGRHWMTNGGCIYVDMSHLEVCPPETHSARDHAAAMHAMYWMARRCRRRALWRLPSGDDLFVNVHNSDGAPETSWGAHLNINVSRAFWDDLFRHHRPHAMALMAAFVAATVPVFGQGLVWRGKEGARFLTSARAPHLGRLVTLSTTDEFERGLLNSRDESHASAGRARLHLIAYDASLQPWTIAVRAGLLQLVVAAMQQGWFDPGLLLDDPVAAVRAWSSGLDVRAGAFRPPPARGAAGESVGPFDWHGRLLDALYRLAAAGAFPDELVPDAGWVLDQWAETLDDLRREDTPRLARRLDWALKWTVLAEQAEADGLEDPGVRLLDLYYGHVDDRIGLFWQFWRDNMIDSPIGPADLRRFLFAGDPTTRSGLRGELVRRLWPWVTSMEWDSIDLCLEPDADWWRGAQRSTLALGDPDVPGGPIANRLRAAAPDDRQLLDLLISTRRDRGPTQLAPPRY